VAEYKTSFHEFDSALVFYRKAESQTSVNRIIPWIAEMYGIMQSLDLDIEPEFSSERKTIEIHFRVKEILESGGDSVLVLLDAGTYDGVFTGAKGEALGVYSSETPDRGNEILGRAEIISATSNTAKALVKLVDPNTPEFAVMQGDMIKLPARVKETYNTSIIYELSLLNIDFLTNASKPLYHVRQVMNSEDPELENDILSIMKTDIIETADIIRPLIPDNPSWGEPQEAGRFKGISLVDALEQVTNEDVLSFLRFVESFPGKYMGHTWKINETYATWIINATPIGHMDLLEAILAAANDTQFNELLENHYDDLEDGDFYTYWQGEAGDLAERGRFDEAYRINEVLFRIAEQVSDTNLLGWAWFLEAQILTEEYKYEEAISSYAEAKTQFERSGNINGVSYCINNIALQYNNLDRYNDALEAYKQSYEVKLERMKTDNSSNMKESIARSIEGIASAQYNLSMFDEALEMYELSNQYYQSANTIDGLSGQAGNYKWLGKIHEKQGNYDEAIRYFREKERMHQEMGDLAGEADVLDDIAWIKSVIGETRAANEIYEQASQIKLKLDDKDGAGFSKANVGQTYWTLGEYDKAIEAHQL
jgi:tetratricopeptide (TPR) repeat protein